jgi:hypothetical protein
VIADARRARRIAERCIGDLELDLRGLVVYTEAASGNYVFTPLLAALAGADRVLALARPSHYGTPEDICRATLTLAREWGVAARVDVRFEKTEPDVATSDIITNTGFVRPLDREMVGWMKATAVIPLMWETWEKRDGEVDLDACRDRGVLVLGTREDQLPHSLYPYCGFAALKLLFELGLEGYRTRVVLLGSGILPASIHDTFARAGIATDWFGEERPPSTRADHGARSGRGYPALRQFWAEEGSRCDAILLADMFTRGPLIGAEGWVTIGELTAANPIVRVGVIAGQSDFDALAAAGIRVHPTRPRPFGYMSYQPDALGPKPVLELYAAGLRVGEVMARARIGGLSVDDARARALTESPAMDFTRP